jgi:NAD(P)-dependent dehydrogenase (short-subunit alcohol dehydrogenase family)
MKQAIRNIRKAFGPITVLINNAAHDERHKLDEVTPDYFDDRMRVNLKHQFFAIQEVVPDMKKAKNGSIVNLTSTSYMVAFGGLPVYTAAKAGVVGMTRGLARELGQYNIRINAFAPGWIMTERQKQLWVTPEAIEQLMQDQCLQRTLEPAEMARAILFLASDESSATTNQTFVFDGGWL